jgi:hypothetical protein
MFSLGILISLMLSGCAHNPPASDFDRAESFVKPIDTGLYFIREVDSKGIFTEKEKPIDAWKIQAQTLCPSGYKTLLINDDDLSYQGVDVTYMGSFVMVLPGTNYLSAIDGIVLCNSSVLSEKQVTKILIDEYYIVPEQT